jgi:hypothetical protein
MWCADHPAFVGCLGDGQALIFCPSGYKHTALETIGLNDRGVSRMDFVHKRDKLTCGHMYVPLYSKAKNNFQIAEGRGLKPGREYPEGRRISCSLLHSSDFIARRYRTG